MPPLAQKQFANMLIDRIEIFPTKREMGYLKSIHFKIPVFRSHGELTEVMTIWDYYPDILDEDGNYNGNAQEGDMPPMAFENGTVAVVEEYGEEEQKRLQKIRYERINHMRKSKGLPELTEEQFLALCRPKQFTDETIVCLCKQ